MNENDIRPMSVIYKYTDIKLEDIEIPDVLKLKGLVTRIQMKAAIFVFFVEMKVTNIATRREECQDELIRGPDMKLLKTVELCQLRLNENPLLTATVASI